MTEAASPGCPPPDATCTPATVERFGDVTHDAFLQFTALYDGGRTGERFLLGRTVGNDHHTFDLGRVFLERNIDPGFGADGNFHRLVTQVGDDERGFGRNLRKRILSVDVGRGALRSAVDQDIGADDGFAVGSGDFSADGSGLSR